MKQSVPVEELLNAARTAFDECTHLLIFAGAGMSVDSGLPDFRSDGGFWNAYPLLKELKLTYELLSTPKMFEENPELAWGFFGHKYELVNSKTPHRGYEILLNKCKSLGWDKSFVVTSNVDGFFERAGFNPHNIYEIHGSMHWMQQKNPRKNGDDVIETKTIAELQSGNLAVDPKTVKLTSKLPEANLRPNIWMFDDNAFSRKRADIQRENYEWDFKQEAFMTGGGTRLLILEIGAGTGVMTIRQMGSTVAKQIKERRYHLADNSWFVRVNPEMYHVQDGKARRSWQFLDAIGVPMKALEFLEKMPEPKVRSNEIVVEKEKPMPVAPQFDDWDEFN